MWYLYLDESGDLGFDFVHKKPSNYFTIGILAINGVENNRKIIKGVRNTIRRKLNPKGKTKRIVEELKGSSSRFEVKEYLYKQIKDIDFRIYSFTLNKRKLYDRLSKNKSRVYNFIARKVLDQIPFENNGDRVYFTLDKCMSKPEIAEFNEYIRKALEFRLSSKIRLDIYHKNSHESPGLQAIDMICWGIFQKYERKNLEWINIFKKKIKFDKQYL